MGKIYQIIIAMLVVAMVFVSFQWHEAAGSRDSYYESLQNEHQLYEELETPNAYLVAECDRWQREAGQLRREIAAAAAPTAVSPTAEEAAETVVSLLTDQVAADVRRQLALPPTPVGSMLKVLGDWAKNGIPKVTEATFMEVPKYSADDAEFDAGWGPDEVFVEHFVESFERTSSTKMDEAQLSFVLTEVAPRFREIGYRLYLESGRAPMGQWLQAYFAELAKYGEEVAKEITDRRV